MENFKKEEVDPKSYGQFFAGDSYVLLYTYDGTGVQSHAAFYALTLVSFTRLLHNQCIAA